MATDDPPVDAWEIELDSEWVRERKFREAEYVKAGIGEFLSFRLALRPDIDWHRVVHHKARGVTDETLSDMYLD